MSQGQDSLRATDTIYMFPFNGMIQPGCCPYVTWATVPCCTSRVIRNGPPPMSTLVPAWRRRCYCSSAGSLRGTCPASALTSNWHSETQISSLELSLSCHHVTWWRWKAWCLDTHGFILKKIQWHIHAGPWSLVNCWCKVLMRHYIRYSWILMRVAVGLMEWPRPWWWSVYPAWYPDIVYSFFF